MAPMDVTQATVILMVAAVVVGAALQRVSGTGMGLVIAPLLTLLLGAGTGVLVSNATTTVSAFLLTVAVRRRVEWRRAVLIGVFALPGAILGAIVVGAVPDAGLQVLVGVVVLVALGTSSLVAWLGQLPHVRQPWVTPLAGVLGGAFNATAGVAAPVMVVHARLVRWSQEGFAATMQPVFMTMGALSVLAKTVVTPVVAWVPPWWLAALALLAVVGGIGLGSLLAERVSSETARRTAVVLAALGGASAVVRGMVAPG